MKIVLAGAGAFGVKHLDAVKLIDGIEVESIVGHDLAATQEIARKYGVPHATTELAAALGRPGVAAAILATPTPMHGRELASSSRQMRAPPPGGSPRPRATSCSTSKRSGSPSATRSPIGRRRSSMACRSSSRSGSWRRCQGRGASGSAIPTRPTSPPCMI